jgi:RHH-type proline utilization regulon transcriptional repressor/proline dehydrogenase/delta 1-pyrroline-5-carboxylate dehydrogenase
MAATTLEEAVDVQNGVDYGLTAGIHSLDVAELAVWLERVEAGNLYVNRGITGAIVRRQPFGGWKRSTVGPSAKAGGPNYLLSLGSFSAVEREPDDDIIIEGLSDEVASVVKKSQTGIDFAEFDRVRRAALSDQAAWQSEFGVSRDVSGLGVERNVFRYRPVPVTLRLSEGASLGDLIRLIAAAARTRSPITISTAIPLPTPLTDSFEGPLPSAVVDDLIVETDAAWLARATELTTPRVRLIGGDPLAFAEAIEGTPDVAVWSGPVTTAGRIELLPFLHEQAVSITAHRFGNPDRELIGLPV